MWKRDQAANGRSCGRPERAHRGLGNYKIVSTPGARRSCRNAPNWRSLLMSEDSEDSRINRVTYRRPVIRSRAPSFSTELTAAVVSRMDGQ